MNAKKQREKNRRRANKLAQEAWQAFEDGRADLAIKIIQRAIDLNPANPLLWHDHGSLLVLDGNDDRAAESFQAAIQLAPEFAEAFADLAAIRARQGKMEQAVPLQREALRMAPHPELQQKRLFAYEAMLAAGRRSNLDIHSERGAFVEYGPECESVQAVPDLAATVKSLNWPEIGDRLTARGVAHVRQMLSGQDCELLRFMFDDDQLFAKTVTMNKSRFGKGVYRYFSAPIPPLVDAIRRLAYPQLAAIANRWECLLMREQQYPATWSAFAERCSAVGQTTPSPLLLRYEAGGFNALHQDVRGDVFFPVQLVIVLSSRVDPALGGDNGFTGGEFIFCDQPERKPSDRVVLPAGLGDAVFFCTRSRLVRVGDTYGLKPVKHGLDPVTSGIRFAVGIPFHDFR